MYDFTDDEGTSQPSPDDAFADDVQQVKEDSEREWAKMSNEFAGYREGITAGKDAAIHGAFDSGFFETGAPIGRELGNLRGLAAGVCSLLESSRPLVSERGDKEELLAEIRGIVNGLGRVQFVDLAPPDEEALAHAKEHAGMDGAEALLSAASSASPNREKSLAELTSLRERLGRILEKLGFQGLMPQPANLS